jgi:ADP-heptose:LPS heptosyltransferase
MRLSKYRYRPIHAVCEGLISLAAPLISSVNNGPPRTPVSRVLILKFGGMGEAVLARSLVEHLQKNNPHISFDFLVENRTLEMMTLGEPGEIFLYTPGVDGLTKALKLLSKVRARHYDAILDFEQHSLLTATFARLSGIPIRVGFNPPSVGKRGRMFTHPIELRENHSMWHSFVQIGKVLDPTLSESISTIPLPTSAAAEKWLDEWWKVRVPEDATRPVVAIHLGVGPSAQYRRWPMERFVDLAYSFSKIKRDATFILTGSRGEQPLIAEFQNRFSGKSVDASDVGELEHTATLLRRCDLMISADTGIMHLAAAMGTPTIGLFGPNTPVCWAPVGKRTTYVYPRLQACSPCINSYRRHIPDQCTAAKESACMWDISVEDVMRAASTLGVGPDRSSQAGDSLPQA